MILNFKTPNSLLTTGCLLSMIVAGQNGAAGQNAPVPNSAATAPDQGQLLYSFEDPSDLALAYPAHASISLVKEGATDGTEALRIDFSPTDWPQVKWLPSQPWDWSGRDLALDVTNPTDQAQKFSVRVDDDPTADGWRHSRTGTGIIEARQTGRFIMDVGAYTVANGMPHPSSKPGFSALGSVGSATAFDLHHVVVMEIFLDHPATERSLIVDNIRLLPTSNPELGGKADH